MVAEHEIDTCTFSLFHATSALGAAEQLMAHVNALLDHDTQYEMHSTNDRHHDALKSIAHIVAAIRTEILSRFPNRLHVECALAEWLHELLQEDVKAMQRTRLHDFLEWMRHSEGES